MGTSEHGANARRHEIDFIWQKESREITAIECKWSAGQFDPANLKVFRRLYPQGQNFVVAQDIDPNIPSGLSRIEGGFYRSRGPDTVYAEDAAQGVTDIAEATGPLAS